MTSLFAPVVARASCTPASSRSLLLGLLGIGAALVAFGAVGCMAGDAPPASMDPVGEISAPPTTPPRDAAASSDGGAETCPPRTKRECMTTFMTNGQVRDCRFSFEWCKADGSGWHPCGKQGKGPGGVAIAPD